MKMKNLKKFENFRTNRSIVSNTKIKNLFIQFPFPDQTKTIHQRTAH